MAGLFFFANINNDDLIGILLKQIVNMEHEIKILYSILPKVFFTVIRLFQFIHTIPLV
jgi:hypothetical protein